jgi:hypothetical protein
MVSRFEHWPASRHVVELIQTSDNRERLTLDGDAMVQLVYFGWMISRLLYR